MQSADFANMRRAMVDSQLRTSGVMEPWVLAAMGAVARENFVPAALREIAYMDRSIVLDNGAVAFFYRAIRIPDLYRYRAP